MRAHIQITAAITVFILLKASDISTTALLSPDFSLAFNPLAYRLSPALFMLFQAVVAIVFSLGIIKYFTAAELYSISSKNFRTYLARLWNSIDTESSAQTLGKVMVLIGRIALYCFVPISAVIICCNVAMLSFPSVLPGYLAWGRLLVRLFALGLYVVSIIHFLHSSFLRAAKPAR